MPTEYNKSHTRGILKKNDKYMTNARMGQGGGGMGTLVIDWAIT